MSRAELEAHHYRPADGEHDCGNCSYLKGGVCSMFDVQVRNDYVCDDWAARVEKAANVELHLHVVGMQVSPSGSRVYRLATRDGHYVGRTNPTKVRALKGDVVKVNAAHVRMTQAGDLDWMNVEVAAIRAGVRADSRRDILGRLTGGKQVPELAMIKDDATPVPPAGDQGAVDAESVVTVPTEAANSDVHVNRPLKNISLYYGPKGKRRAKKMKVAKYGAKQLIYGIVLEPDVIDSQADFVPAEHVENAAHGYLKKALRGKSSVSKLRHLQRGFSVNKPSVVPVESFIAPVDFTYPGSTEPVKKGSWVMVVHVEDPNVWQDVLDGHYGGFSVGGTGKRERMGGLYQPPPLPSM